MTAAPALLERLTRVAPFGVRFWDSVTQSTVDGGLQVTAYPPDHPWRRVAASANRTRTFLWQDLPGLRQVGQGAGDDLYWQSLPPGKRFVIEVIDGEGRFQPFLFSADLPVQDVFRWPGGSPPAASAVPLFSAPARSVPGGQAAIRAELADASTGRPAAWAVLEAHYRGQRLARGLADQRGRVALIFPFPELSHPAMSPPDSPPGGGRLALVQQTWPIDLHAFYSPQSAVPDIPDLAVVSGQLAAALHYSLSPPLPLAPVTLTFGRELVVTSQSQSVLWISAA